MKRTRHTPEQVVGKRREADVMLAAGNEGMWPVRALPKTAGTDGMPRPSRHLPGGGGAEA